MIILRQKNYSKTSKMIKGALIAAPVGLISGTVIGGKLGKKKASKEEKEEAAKKRIAENEEQIKANKKNLPHYKKLAQEERKLRGPKENWDNLDRVEIEMADDVWKDIPKENKRLKEENKELKSGNYNSILADETTTGKKHLKSGAILGTAAGMGTGALLGYGLHKILKK